MPCVSSGIELGYDHTVSAPSLSHTGAHNYVLDTSSSNNIVVHMGSVCQRRGPVCADKINLGESVPCPCSQKVEVKTISDNNTDIIKSDLHSIPIISKINPT